MPYKTILLHAGEFEHLEKQAEVAINIALHERACLIAVAPALPGSVPVDAQEQGSGAGFGLERVRACVQAAGLTAYEERIVSGDMANALCAEARHADLVVLGKGDESSPARSADADFLEYVTLNAPCPVLLVPSAGRVFSIGDRVLIGWNGSMAAARAVRDALPFLQQAKKIHVAMIGALPFPETVTEAMAGFIAYLRRHHVKVEIVQRGIEGNVGQTLLTMAQELTSDLIVMGCAAHPRGGHALLGGATRVALEATTLPLLMSH